MNLNKNYIHVIYQYVHEIIIIKSIRRSRTQSDNTLNFSFDGRIGKLVYICFFWPRTFPLLISNLFGIF